MRKKNVCAYTVLAARITCEHTNIHASHTHKHTHTHTQANARANMHIEDQADS